MPNVLTALKPELLWKHFEAICSIPHPSDHEQALIEYIIDFAKKHNFDYAQDNFGNLVVRKPATPGFENKKTIVLQGHLDMVPEKNNDTVHDFLKDPIQPYIDGDWVKAKGTTLGADNGMGVAATLAVLEDVNLQHGPVEGLFTLQEETGLFGAAALGTDLLKADILLNLDSEEDGAFYIGCAGGITTKIKFNCEFENVANDAKAYKLYIKGLKGGHSGMDIHVGKGNSIKAISRFLLWADGKFNLQLVDINGGSKHNAIPREAVANVIINAKDENEFLSFVKHYDAILKEEIGGNEPEVNFYAEAVSLPSNALSADLKFRLLNSLQGVCHGVIRMHPVIEGLVQTSTNLAVITTSEKSIDLITSQRSSSDDEKQNAAQIVASIFRLAKAEINFGDGYPGWNPDLNSPVLKVSKEVFNNLYAKQPEIKAIHAGLECGIIKEKYPHMDMISFGPTLMAVHSPDEKVQISTVEKFWVLLTEILKNVPNK